MRLATIKYMEQEKAAIMTAQGAILIEDVNKKLNKSWSTELFEIIRLNQLDEINHWYQKEDRTVLQQLDYISEKEIIYSPLYRHPRKIWGIGLNYVEHAADLSEKAPNTEPASFMKPDTTIIGHMDTINIPHQSERTTAEAELGLVIGKECKDVSEEDALDCIAGFTTVIDMTAEDILQKNPRYLTRAKSFDTFFSFGPQLVTKDEVKDILELNVATVINGKTHRKNKVKNMMFPPLHLVSFHSKVMTLLPGDIISTGTPGAIKISQGDKVECHIDGFKELINQVTDLKITEAK